MESSLTVSTANLLLQQSSQQALPSGPGVPQDELRLQLERHRAQADQLAVEFAAIPLASGGATADPTSTKPVPYEANRVVLPATLGNPAGYYNASYIDIPGLSESNLVVAASPSSSVESEAQPQLLADFWRVIWRSGARVVAGIAPTTDWPELPPGRRLVCEDGLEVRLEESSAKSANEWTRLVRLKMPERSNGNSSGGGGGSRTRSVWLLRYSGKWDCCQYGGGGGGCNGPIDCAVPSSVADFLAFLDDLTSLRQALSLQLPSLEDRGQGDHGNGDCHFVADASSSSTSAGIRLLLHCRDGASHSGLAVCSLAYRASLQRNSPPPLPLPRLLAALRCGQRMRLLACRRQYEFVCDAGLTTLLLDSSRLI